MDAPDIIVCYDGTLIVVTPENDVLSERWAAEACEVDELWNRAASPYRDLRSMFDYRFAVEE